MLKPNGHKFKTNQRLVSIFCGFLLFFLPLGRPIGDVVQTGPDPRQVQEGAGGLFHLLIVTLGGFFCASLFEGQRVAGDLPGLGEVLPLLVLGCVPAVPQGVLGLLLAGFPVILLCLAVALVALEASLTALLAPLCGKLIVVVSRGRGRGYGVAGGRGASSSGGLGAAVVVILLGIAADHRGATRRLALSPHPATGDAIPADEEKKHQITSSLAKAPANTASNPRTRLTGATISADGPQSPPCLLVHPFPPPPTRSLNPCV